MADNDRPEEITEELNPTDLSQTQEKGLMIIFFHLKKARIGLQDIKAQTKKATTPLIKLIMLLIKTTAKLKFSTQHRSKHASIPMMT